MNKHSPGGRAPLQVTDDFVDPLFDAPYIDVNEIREEPAPHRYVHGGFKDTKARFSFYFPSSERYEGRFHHNTYPLAASEDIGPFPIAFHIATGNLGFTLDSGAYYVQTNLGGEFRRPGSDPSIAAFRVNAAAAKYSRVVAAELYGPHRPFGYLYGGSGGAHQTLGTAENTSGVWDGFMPFVMGCNNSVPSVFTVRTHALRILKRRNKFPAIMDAINPGGSGDMYAGLNDEERTALKEATLMGFPPRGWYEHATLGSGYLADIAPVIAGIDPTYVDDFWSKPGYLGGDSAASIRNDRFTFDTTVTGVVDGPAKRIILADVPDQAFADAYLVPLSGAATGRGLAITSIEGHAVGFARPSDPEIVNAIRVNDKIRIDNSWPLAMQTYHRHQVPPSPEEYGWNQFRDSNGKPIYPQRNVLIGNVFSASGALLTGRIHGKVLFVAALMDIDALPWQADWYRSQVKAAMGSAFTDNFALWYIDHAQHDIPLTPLAHAHTVSLAGALQQGLRDLSRWVEEDVRPAETNYKVVDSQIEVSTHASERGGVQPIVEIMANGGLCAKVSVGESVTFTAKIETPEAGGRVVAAEWDFEGAGCYPVTEDLGTPHALVNLSARHVYAKPGTYYVVLRATAHRDGNKETPYARIQNIARARVIVT